jgi:hypothetical protein
VYTVLILVLMLLVSRLLSHPPQAVMIRQVMLASKGHTHENVKDHRLTHNAYFCISIEENSLFNDILKFAGRTELATSGC